ncbi:hypothetical protein Tco_0702816 [Tanacetum coccineum]|uniref:Uncharacterized protein n=1 Tax=Tanacetum coccineum TaxID=301880 RepID=A0ABQ4XX36_9ASTR
MKKWLGNSEEWKQRRENVELMKKKQIKEALIKNFDDIKARIEADRILAEKLQRARKKQSDEDFIAIGSVEDDRLIKRMNKKDSSKGEEIKQESKEEVKEEDKEEENTRKRKHAPDEDKEVDYEILDKKYPIIDWKTENLGTKPQFDESKRSEEINMNVVTRSNGQKRCFSTLIRVLSVFDREDLDAVYKLVMDIYQDKIPKDVHMLIEKKFLLKKEILMPNAKAKLESEEESTIGIGIRYWQGGGVQRSTVLGKELLQSVDELIVCLPKIVGFSTHLASVVKSWLVQTQTVFELSIPEQTATGKGTSNPLMAGSLPKTTKPT